MLRSSDGLVQTTLVTDIHIGELAVGVNERVAVHVVASASGTRETAGSPLSLELSKIAEQLLCFNFGHSIIPFDSIIAECGIVGKAKKIGAQYPLRPYVLCNGEAGRAGRPRISYFRFRLRLCKCRVK